MDAKLHVPIVSLSTKDNVNLTKQLNDGFKKYVYWSSYQTIPAKVIEKGKKHIWTISASFSVIESIFFQEERWRDWKL